jgi:putative endonuclease
MSHRNIMLGAWGEDRVAEYLVKERCVLLDRNWRHPLGELDLIVLTPDGAIAFVEVKTRSSTRFGDPLEAISRAKEIRLELLARAWLSESPTFWQRFRVDYAAVVGDGVSECQIEYLIGQTQ